jgi:hypothetical protein
MNTLEDNLNRVRSRIGKAELIVVTKTVPAEIIAQLPELGVKIVGENRVQEAEAKMMKGLRWHLIGSLQTNKVKKALRLFEAIHSVDRMELVEALDKSVQVFIEVNIAGESTKHGVKPEETPSFVRRAKEKLNVVGLMTMAPMSDDPENSRPHFRKLAALAKECGLPCTSMGMSQDYEVAVQEGATHVRVGSAIFKGVVPA